MQSEMLETRSFMGEFYFSKELDSFSQGAKEGKNVSCQAARLYSVLQY